ncbi:MAG: PEP-CTERM sorting domain-containing protein [Planctomycetota bacterium]|jgi:hypothetical protein
MAAIGRTGLSGLLILGAIFGGSAAGAVVFDFEAVPLDGGAAEIETYMEGLYGSGITVVGGTVRDSLMPGVSAPLGDDQYVRACHDCASSSISISFDDVAITSVLFDYGMVSSSFYALADGAVVFGQGWQHWGSGNTAISFGSPVTTLTFMNDGPGEIEIDTLVVTPVPEPSVVVLLGLGAMMVRRRVRGS